MKTIFTALLVIFIAHGARAKTVYLLDFDGTIVDDQGPRSTWRRMWHLKRVEELRNMHQADPQAAGLPLTMAVSYREYQKLLPRLARGEAKLNWLSPVDLERDPLHPERSATLIPGYYYVSKDVTFSEYRPAVGEASHLVRVQEEALQRTRIENEALARRLGREPDENERMDWRGPAWALVRRAMSDPRTVEDVKIFTAGNHWDWEWQKLFDIWQREGEVTYASGTRLEEVTRPKVYAMSDPGALVFGRASYVQRKGAVLRAVAEDLADTSRDRHFELSADARHVASGLEREGHTLIVADDDPQMLAELRQKLMTLSAEMHVGGQVKFVLLNAMPAGERALDRLWPHQWTVFHRRVARAATPEEIALWTGRPECEGDLTNLTSKRL